MSLDSHIVLTTTDSQDRIRALERELEQLKQGRRIHDELLQLMLEGRDLEAVVERLAVVIGNPVAVADHLYHVIATAPRGEHGDRHRRATINRGATAREILDKPVVGRFFRRVAEERRPVLFPAFPEHGMDQRRLMAPILAGRDMLGFVTVLEEQVPLQDFHAPILQQAAVMLALELVKQRAVLEAEMALRADFLRDLFSGNYASRESLAMRANLLNIDLFRPWDLLVVEPDEVESQVVRAESSAARFTTARGQLLEVVRRSARSHDPGSIVIAQSDGIILLHPAGRNVGASAELADVLRDQVRHTFRAARLTISVGIGGRCECPADFGRRHAEARRVLQVSRSLRRRDQTLTPDALGVYGILYQRGSEDDLTRFALRTLGPILDYDRRRGTALLETLEAYFEEDGALRKAAARLHVHLNTLRGRLDRIRELIQADVSDARVRLSLQLALEINRVAARRGAGDGACAPE